MTFGIGDIHGRLNHWKKITARILTAEDVIFGLGDFGGVSVESEDAFYDYLAEQEYKVLFLDGNHENFDRLNQYPVSEWKGGKVHFVRHNVIHLMRGEIYEIDGKKLFVMGGGYSEDRAYRIQGESWWPEEMPSDEEYRNAARNLENCGFKVDYILTHTAPSDTVEYLYRLRKTSKYRASEEYPLNEFLQWVADMTDYGKWYFGHFHTDAELWKNQYAVYEGIRELNTGKLIKMRKG